MLVRKEDLDQFASLPAERQACAGHDLEWRIGADQKLSHTLIAHDPVRGLALCAQVDL